MIFPGFSMILFREERLWSPAAVGRMEYIVLVATSTAAAEVVVD